MLPINIQLFLDSLLGKTNTVTEKDFSLEDLDVLRKLGDKRSVAEDTVRQNRLALLEPRLENYLPQTQARLVDKANSHTINRQVQYGHYTKDLPDNNNWTSALTKSFNDPAFRISTSLGNFGMEDKGDHYRVYDKYNWNGDFEKPIKSLGDLWEQASFSKPTEFLNGLAELYAPKVSRPVDIKVYKK